MFIDVEVEGVDQGTLWQCGLEFYYANEESFYCRPLRQDGCGETGAVPPQASEVTVAFLPPMSGLAATEPKLEPGRINVLIGEGQTAQVLRNLCYQLHHLDGARERWDKLVASIDRLFGVLLQLPEHVEQRGEIVMGYQEHGISLDIACSGRGLQQTLLLLAHLYANPDTVLLLDEPDAHLEILRQRQIYDLISETAAEQNAQVVVASHSEVLLNQAAARDLVIAFVGAPHRIDDRGSQEAKALRDIPFDDYYQAEQTGWVLYLEGSTDLAMLRAFARRLSHQAADLLERPFVHYVGNLPNRVREHFYGLRAAKQDLVGIAIFDRVGSELECEGPLREFMWGRREIENYLCTETVLLSYAGPRPTDNLEERDGAVRRHEAMQSAIQEVAGALRTLGKDPWSDDTKVTDEFLDPLFDLYFAKLGLPNQLRKTNYHVLAELVPPDEISPDIVAALDAIAEVASQARPRR